MVLAAVAQNGLALQVLTRRACYNIACVALRRTAPARRAAARAERCRAERRGPQHASWGLRGEAAVVLAAVGQHGFAMEHAQPALQVHGPPPWLPRCARPAAAAAAAAAHSPHHASQ